MKKIKNLYFLFLFSTTFYSQTTYNKIIWDKEKNSAVQYATINTSNDYSITNEEGFFSLTTSENIADFNMLGYESQEINLKVEKDTIYVISKPYGLDEVVINTNSFYKSMINTITKDYALEPHNEQFYLRAVLKKNDEIIKIVDLSGKVRKETLFNTKSRPMPKKNYKVNVENIRKAGLVFKDYDFTIINFNDFFERHNRFYIGPKNFNLEYKTSKDSLYTKINATQKTKTSIGDVKGFFLVNRDSKNFEKANIAIKYTDEYNVINKDLKNKTLYFEVESDFKRSDINNKLQITKCKMYIIVENIFKQQTDIFKLSFIYFAEPIGQELKIKNNVNLNKDIFELKYKYDESFWINQDKLPLTTEMQEFINEVNSSGKNSDFKTKTNIKE